MAESGEERTEEPSPRRRRQAREKGEIARSPELATTLTILGWLAVLGILLPDIWTGLMQESRRLLSACAEGRQADILKHLSASLAACLGLIAPVLGVGVVLAAVAQILQVGFLTVPVKMDFNRVNPVSGLTRMARWETLWDFVRAFLKIGAVTWIVYGHLFDGWKDFLGLAAVSPMSLPLEFAQRLAQLAWKIAGLWILFAAADYGFRYWRHEMQLKMTKQQAKQERKESEGSPLIRSRIRKLQRQMAQQRTAQSVPNADVVVTNPTHYAIALRYRSEQMQAPQVVAKGAGETAQMIIRLAAEHRIPVTRNAPLARALFRTTEAGQYVPADLFQPVAEIFAWLYKLEAAKGSS